MSGFESRQISEALQVVQKWEELKKTQIFFLPTYKWNNYDKSLIGLAFYNRILPSNGLTYTLNPLYSTKQNFYNSNVVPIIFIIL